MALELFFVSARTNKRHHPSSVRVTVPRIKPIAGASCESTARGFTLSVDLILAELRQS
jgi:hypothetical protein